MMWRSGTKILCCLITALATCDPSSNLLAQAPPDTVWLEPSKTDSSKDAWYPRPITKIEGKIQSFDHQAMDFIIEGEESETAFAAHRVLWIRPGVISESENALQSLQAERKRPTSLDRLSSLLRDKNLQPWRKQMAYMRFSNLCFRTSDYRTAIALSGEFGGPLPPLVLAWLPVAWTREHQVPVEYPYREGDSAENSLQTQLVLVSWKLQSLGRETAVATIDQIIADPSRPYIQQLAKALRWRLATPQEVVENAETWEADIDAMPMALQVGPTFTLIEKFEAAGLADRAERLRLSLKLTPPFPHPDLSPDQ